MNICFCIDENYVLQLGAVLGSLIESNGNNNIEIYVIQKALSKKSKEKLRSVIALSSTFSITFINTVDEKITTLEAGGHISSATYIRFEIPELLTNLDKVLYLDADLAITDDLTELWSTPLLDNFIGAVNNPFFNRHLAIKIDPEHGYFNAGVLLMNLQKWRDEDLKSKALQFLNNYKEEAIMYDQDALNHVIRGQWLSLPIRWNLQTSFIRRRKELPNEQQEVKQAFLNPGIVHYSSSSKPWDFLDPHPLRQHYRKNECLLGKYRKKLTTKQLIKSLFKYIYLTIVFKYAMKD